MLLLNLTFDIGVKLVTMHLIALALILLAPVARPLAGVLVRLKAGTTTEIRLKPDAADPTSRQPLTSRRAIAVPLLLGVYLLGMQAWINWSFWQVGGGGRPKSVLYGIWNVERLSVDGQVGPRS